MGVEGTLAGVTTLLNMACLQDRRRLAGVTREDVQSGAGDVKGDEEQLLAVLLPASKNLQY